MTIKAVGFDIDGTLYPDQRLHFRSAHYFFKNFHTVLAFSRARRVMRQTGNDDEKAELEIFAEELRCDIETARSIRDRVIYSGWERTFEGMKIYRGVREALERLKSAGLLLAVLSDFPVGRKLLYFGLGDIFDVALGFPESGRLKPNVEPFQRMAAGLGLVPGEMIYIGNKLGYDARGAENAGMRGALIGPPGRRAPADVITYADYKSMADRILSEVTK